MKLETAGKVKYGSWGLFCGAIVAMIIGFGWGGWTTAATTQKMTDEAILTGQTAICIAQFMGEPDHVEKLKEYEKVSYWERSELIEKAGWDKMPGQEKADDGVASACSEELEQYFSN